MHMSKQFFTDKQMADLLLNPNVFSVTRSTLMLTKSFKEKFYAEYLKEESFKTNHSDPTFYFPQKCR